MTASSDENAELMAEWEAFAAEAKELLAIDVEEMTPEQLERLERLSEPLIQLVNYARRSRTGSELSDSTKELNKFERQRAHDDEPRLSDADVRALSRRVVADLEADRFGVLTPLYPPGARLLRHPAPVTSVVDEAALWHQTALIDLDVAAGAGRELWDAECEAWMPLPPEVPRGRHLALKVTGASMEPLVHGGDVIVVRLGEDVARDTIIVARDPDHGYVVKRVEATSRRSIDLVSLNRAFPPVRIPRIANAVLGTVVLRWCGHDLPHDRVRQG